MQMVNRDTEISTGTEIEFNFPGTQEELEEAQERFHSRIAREEEFNRRFNDNALRGIRSCIRKKHGDGSVSVLAVLRIIRDNGYMDDEFLKTTFQLTANDVRRALELGLVPPSIKTMLSRHLAIQD